MDSTAFANLKRLSAIDEALSVAKLKNIKAGLAAPKACCERRQKYSKPSAFASSACFNR